MSLYTDTIRKWAMDNRRVGRLPDADGTGEVGLTSTEAGRRLAVRFTLKVESGRVAEACYQVFGCGFSMAACAVAAEMAVGYELKEVQKIDAKRLDDALEGLPPERGYCVALAVKALHAAARSARAGRDKVAANLPDDVDHGPRISAEHPVYAALVNSPRLVGVTDDDRHLFACLLAVASQGPGDPAAALGLHESDLSAMLGSYFPGIDRTVLGPHPVQVARQTAALDEELLAILLSHVPKDRGRGKRYASVWLARTLAARSACPGHLWVAMGLTERPQLSAAIRRHLPSLAVANHNNMRWKRFLFKQLCDRNGGVMCKAPNCGECSDYALCFAEE
jgi:nitrogen fixation protein NifQ